jgi:hypothetical protein
MEICWSGRRRAYSGGLRNDICSASLDWYLHFNSKQALVAKAVGVTIAGITVEGVLVAHFPISWAMDIHASIFHLDAALNALNNIHTTADKLEIELNFTKSALYNLETIIQLLGK